MTEKRLELMANNFIRLMDDLRWGFASENVELLETADQKIRSNHDSGLLTVDQYIALRNTAHVYMKILKEGGPK